MLALVLLPLLRALLLIALGLLLLLLGLPLLLLGLPLLLRLFLVSAFLRWILRCCLLFSPILPLLPFLL